MIDVVEGSDNVRPKMALSLWSEYGKGKLSDLVIGEHYPGEVSRIVWVGPLTERIVFGK